MNTNISITQMLAAPLSPDWTIEGLAEQLLGAIAARQPQPGGEVDELVLEADVAKDRQSRRLLRPLLACLATKSAAESGTPVNLFAGHLVFRRPGPAGAVWITGDFENRPGVVRVAFRRSDAAPASTDPRSQQSTVVTGANSQADASQCITGPSGPESAF